MLCVREEREECVCEREEREECVCVQDKGSVLPDDIHHFWGELAQVGCRDIPLVVLVLCACMYVLYGKPNPSFH